MKNWTEVKASLFALRNTGSRFGIERMERLAALLGHPERCYPVIHVAGTNGKGSVCAMLEAIYRVAGHRVGLMTSPHLVRVGERVQVNREPLSESEIVAHFNALEPVAAQLALEDPELHPTFFEFISAMGFLHFARQAVDLAVVEVGLGGRLDATNVVQPAVSVITSIGLDHQAILGSTLEAIAGEKGGIIKPGRPVVLGVLPAEAEGVLRALAGERGCRVWSVRERFSLSPCGYALTPGDYDRLPTTRLPGRLQRLNAATAWLTTEVVDGLAKLTSLVKTTNLAELTDLTELTDLAELTDLTELTNLARRPTAVLGAAAQPVAKPGIKRLQITDADRLQGLATVQWAGRWEERLLDNGVRLILDATHNAEGIREVEPQIAELHHQLRGNLTILTGVLGEDRAREILPVLSRYARQLYLVRPSQPRALATEALLNLLPPTFRGVATPLPQLTEAFPSAGRCSLVGPGETLLVIGSIYLIGEILQLLCPPPPEADTSLHDRF